MLRILACALLLCLPAQAFAQQPCQCPPEARVIQVEGQGEVSLSPTVGEATLVIETTTESAAKAMDQVSVATSQVLEALKRWITAEDRVTTEGYDLFPIYDYEKGKRREGTLVGYRARSRLLLKVAGPNRLGALLDAAVSAGATGISGIGFSNPGLAEARREAAASALKDARRMAERLAAEAGVNAGRLLSVSTAAEPWPTPMRFGGALAPAETPPPIEPGELQVRATASAVYEIK